MVPTPLESYTNLLPLTQQYIMQKVQSVVTEIVMLSRCVDNLIMIMHACITILFTLVILCRTSGKTRILPFWPAFVPSAPQSFSHVSMQVSLCLLPTISRFVAPSTTQQSFVPSFVPAAPHDSLHWPKCPQLSHVQRLWHESVHLSMCLLLGISRCVISSIAQQVFWPAFVPSAPHDSLHALKSSHGPHVQSFLHVSVQASCCLLPTISTFVAPSTTQQSFVPSFVPSASHISLQGPKSQGPHFSIGQGMLHVSVHSSTRLVLGISFPVSLLTSQHSFVPFFSPSAPHDTLHEPYVHSPHLLVLPGNKILSIV